MVPMVFHFSLFTFHRHTGTIYLLLYVDDIIIITSSKALISKVITQLSYEFPITDIGPLSLFLGIASTHGSSTLFISKFVFAWEIITSVNMVTCNPYCT